MNAYAPPSTKLDVRPRAIVWYRTYAAFMLFLGLAIAALSATLDSYAMLLASASVASAAFYGVATFAPFKPWGWTLGLVAIALGLATPLIVLAFPLLLAWNKPLVRAAFRRL